MNLCLLKKLISIIAFLFCLCFVTEAQNFVVKTNTLYSATSTPNFGFESTIGQKLTIELEAGYNPWQFRTEANSKLKHLLVSPEVKYWFCEPYLGHFLGLSSNLVYYNIGGLPVDIYGLKDNRHQGHAASLGFDYGYSLPVSRRWNVEFNVGMGLWYTQYDRYVSKKCGLFHETVSKCALGLTSLGASFVYILK